VEILQLKRAQPGAIPDLPYKMIATPFGRCRRFASASLAFVSGLLSMIL
jgi:hypothetical protein